MKRFFALLLVLTIAISLCACSKEETNLAAFSKPAYAKINEAYEIIDEYGSDVYEAWRIAINSKYDLTDGGWSYMAKELHLSQTELEEGVAYTLSQLDFSKKWEGNEDYFRQQVDAVLEKDYSNLSVHYTYLGVDLFTFCVWSVSNAYELNGKTGNAQAAMDEAKNILHTLATDHYDYYHYSDLKNYYVTVNSYLEYCKSPSGSFEQSITTINEYRNQARLYKTSLGILYLEDEATPTETTEKVI